VFTESYPDANSPGPRVGDAEPTGIIFFGSGEELLVNIQRHNANNTLGARQPWRAREDLRLQGQVERQRLGPIARICALMTSVATGDRGFPIGSRVEPERRF
jgi:hypothetical protein